MMMTMGPWSVSNSRSHTRCRQEDEGTPASTRTQDTRQRRQTGHTETDSWGSGGSAEDNVKHTLVIPTAEHPSADMSHHHVMCCCSVAPSQRGHPTRDSLGQRERDRDRHSTNPLLPSSTGNVVMGSSKQAQLPMHLNKVGTEYRVHKQAKQALFVFNSHIISTERERLD